MANSPLIVTWPGGIGNPIGEKIPTSGGKRKAKSKASRRSKKSTRKHRTRKTRRTVRR